MASPAAGAEAIGAERLSVRRTRRRATSPPLEIFTLGYPRAFVYRQASELAGLLDYPTWLSQMSQLNGIIGKLLAEEEPVPANALAYFQQFKSQFPAKAVMLHMNGWERVPQFETTNWFAGFWLHKAGTTLTQPCAATDTTLFVGATTCFTLQAGYQNNRGDDICIAAMGSNGQADFTSAEQVILTGINATAGTIAVQRGQYGTVPLSFAAGSFLAAHVTRGPFIGNGPMLWMYNFSTMAPKDPNGHTVIDGIISGMAPGQGLAAKFAPGGPLANIDGMKLDAFSWVPPLQFNCDCNNDGIADNGVFNGVNTFGTGETNLVRAVRALLGSGRFIIVDAETVSRQRPDSGLESGLELEGFPNLYDSTAAQWSEGVANLQYYSSNFTNSPALVYPNYKTDRFVPIPTVDNMFRLTLAASLLTGTEFTFYTDADGATPINGQLKNLTIFDELIGGTLQTSNWLGQPVGPAQHLSLQNDVLNGGGVTMTSAFAAMLQSSNGNVSYSNQGSAGATLTVQGTGSPLPGTLAFVLHGVALTGGDLIVTFDVMSSTETPYSPTLCRRLFVVGQRLGGTNGSTQSTPTGGNWTSVVLYFRGLNGTGKTANVSFTIEGPQSVTLRNVRAYNGPDVAFRQFENGAVFANPSLSPYTFPVSTLAPGVSYSRLQATSGNGQDPATNNGQPIGTSVTVPAIDALIVIG